MITTLIQVFAATLREVLIAGQDARRQEEALMSAEEKLARMRAKAKYRK